MATSTTYPVTGETTTPLEQLQNRYGGVDQAQGVLDKVAIYRDKNKNLFPSSLDPIEGRNASPKIDPTTMGQSLGVKTVPFESESKQGGVSQDGVEIAPGLFGRAREATIQHEAIHKTDEEPITDENAVNVLKSLKRDLTPNYKTEGTKIGSKTFAPTHSNYLMNRLELNARLPRLNSMHMASGGAFPTTPEEGEVVLNNFGFTRGDAPPKLQDKHLKELNRNRDIFDLQEAFWKMSKPERIRFMDERSIRQPGQAKNSPQEKPLDAVV